MTEPEPFYQQTVRIRQRLRTRLLDYAIRHGGLSLHAAMLDTMEQGLDLDESEEKQTEVGNA